MFHFLPIAIRYDGSSPADADDHGHGYQVHVGPMFSDAPRLGEDPLDRPARAPGDPVQLPVDRAGPPRVDRGDPHGAPDPYRSRRSRRTTAARSRPGRRSRPTRRSWTGSPATPRRRCTRRAPARLGTDEMSCRRPGDVPGARRRRVAGRRRLGAADRHQRQHLRADDDGRRTAADLILGNQLLPPSDADVWLPR